MSAMSSPTVPRGNMSTTVRPQLTTGVAALSVSAIIAATLTAAPHHPTAPTPLERPDVVISAELAALANPLATIDQNVQTTLAGIGQFVAGLSSNPLIAAAFGSQTVTTLKHLVAIAQSAITDFGTSLTEDLSPEAENVLQLVQAGNWQAALDAVESTATTIKTVPTVVLQAVLLGSAGQLLQSVTPGVTALQSALKTGNLGKALTAVATITKTVVSSVLGKTGLISQLLGIAQVLGQVSSPTTAAAATAKAASVAALPSSSAATLTLSKAATAAAVTSAASATQEKTSATTTSKTKKDRRTRHAVADASAGDGTSVAATTASTSSTASSDDSTAASSGNTKSGKASNTKRTHGKDSHQASSSHGHGNHAAHGAK